MNLKTLQNKRILILGFGREGIDNFKFLRKLFPNKILGVGDRLKFRRLKSEVKNLLKKDKKIKLHLGQNYLKAIKNYDLIIKTPGIPPKIIKPFLKKRQKITSQTEIFFENCPGRIIGITGTKGKSTTASLIYAILKTGGTKAHLIGNIGKPALSFLSSATKKDIYVYELSSHQLFNLKKSPQVAIFLNLYREHLDYYNSFNEYLKAKQNICRYQETENFFIYNPENAYIRKTAKITKAKKIPIETKNIKKIIKIKDIPLIGKFNLQNLAAAIEVGKILGISDKDIKKAIREFKNLPHRLELVGEFKKIKFYNDSLATIPEATIEAINALGKSLQTIILGGFDRRQDFKNLAKGILKSNIETIILFPTTGKRIWKEAFQLRREMFSSDCELPEHFFINNMKEAVELAFEFTRPGKICLLSPAAASFNLFRNYQERGNLFKKYVKQFSKNR